MLRRCFASLPALASTFLILLTSAGAAPVTFVFTSDLHFGLTRSYFRGAANVAATEVNAALAAAINRVPAARFPADAGLRAAQSVGPLDFVMVTGDIANRQEMLPLRIQPAAVSWAQFETHFAQRLAVTNAAGAAAPLLLVPGNHDASNAIGAPVPMLPATDATAMVAIYNRMMRPAVPKTNSDYRYTSDPVRYIREFG
ncbi:MAG: metallophosphoesterase, partial [Verrucomicrobiota bacterium]